MSKDEGRGVKWVKVVKRYRLLVVRLIRHGDIIHSMVTIVNNTVL